MAAQRRPALDPTSGAMARSLTAASPVAGYWTAPSRRAAAASKIDRACAGVYV